MKRIILLLIMGVLTLSLSSCIIERQVKVMNTFTNEEIVVETRSRKAKIAIDFVEGYDLEGLYYDEACTELYLKYDPSGLFLQVIDQLLNRNRFNSLPESSLYVIQDSYEGIVDSPLMEKTYYTKWVPKEYSVYTIEETTTQFKGMKLFDNELFVYTDKDIYKHSLFETYNTDTSESYFKKQDYDLDLEEDEVIEEIYVLSEGIAVYTSAHSFISIIYENSSYEVVRVSIPFSKEKLRKIEYNDNSIAFLTFDNQFYGFFSNEYHIFGDFPDFTPRKIRYIGSGFADIFISDKYLLHLDNYKRLYLSGSTSLLETDESMSGIGQYNREKVYTIEEDNDIEKIYFSQNGSTIIIEYTNGQYIAKGSTQNGFFGVEDKYYNDFTDVTSILENKIDGLDMDSFNILVNPDKSISDIEGNLLYEPLQNHGEVIQSFISNKAYITVYEDQYIDVIRSSFAKSKDNVKEDSFEYSYNRLSVNYYHILGLQYIYKEEYLQYYDEVIDYANKTLFYDKEYLNQVTIIEKPTSNIYVYHDSTE